MNSISKSLILKNKAISAALLVMYSLIISLLVATSCIAPSFDKTFNTFFDDYKVFDLLVTTTGTPISLTNKIEEINGIKAVSGKIITDKCIELENGRTLLTRVMNEDSNDDWKIYDVDNNEILNRQDNRVMVSAYFAKHNDVHVGSKIKIIDKDETINLKVTNIIACPETIGVGSYIGSWYDMQDYGFVYVSNNLSEKVFKTNSICNAYKVLIEDENKISEIKKEIKELIGEDYIVDISTYNESNIKTQLDSSINTVKSITLYLPAIIIIIGVLFSLLFIYQVTRKSRKDIALLRAIGYSKNKVQNIFNSYTLVISLSASIIGSLLGFVILRYVINIYKDLYYLPYIKYDGNLIQTLLIIVLINILALLSCFVACRDISKIEPALAFNENEVNESADLPKSLARIKCNPFTKLSLTLIYRNKTRVFVVFLCMIACMLLTMLSVSVLLNKNMALKHTFNNRYDFDLAIFCTDKNDLDDIAKLNYVESYEYAYQNDFTYEDEVMRVEAHPEYSSLEGIILETGFARRHNLNVGDYVKIKNTDIEVVEIQDQYLCSTQYISENTTKKLGYDKPNAIEIKLKNCDEVNKVLSYVSRLDSFLLVVDINSMRYCAESTMAKIDAPCYLIVAFSGLIGFIIMYNMALISFDKRRKEFSTLRALGTENYRIIKLLLAESLGELFAAAIISPLSFPLISLILTLISSTAEEYVLFAPFTILIIAFMLTLIYTLAGVFMTYLSIRKIDIALELNA